MSHEFRTPLNAVIGYTELLEQAEGPRRKEYADELKSGSRRLLDMVNDILELIRTEKADIELVTDYFSFTDMLEEVLPHFKKLASEKGLQFKTDIAPDLPGLILPDAKRLRMVVSNLLDNAVRYTPKGEVVLSVSGNRGSGSEDKFELIIEVRDTGKGISYSDQKKIFEAFSQAGQRSIPGGIGIGLALTNRIVSAMNGTVSLVSSPEQGSTFTLNLPGIPFRLENSGLTGINISPEPDRKPDNIYDPEGLMSLLKGEFKNTWAGFELRQPLNEVRKFGNDLAAAGEKHNCEILKDYGRSLSEAAESFDIDGILRLIRRYPQILESLEN